MTVELRAVHCQRLRDAVEAKRRGADVRLRIDRGDGKVVWHVEGSRVRHVLVGAFGVALEAWRDELEREFRRMLLGEALQ